MRGKRYGSIIKAKVQERKEFLFCISGRVLAQTASHSALRKIGPAKGFTGAFGCAPSNPCTIRHKKYLPDGGLKRERDSFFAYRVACSLKPLRTCPMQKSRPRQRQHCCLCFSRLRIPALYAQKIPPGWRRERDSFFAHRVSKAAQTTAFSL